MSDWTISCESFRDTSRFYLTVQTAKRRQLEEEEKKKRLQLEQEEIARKKRMEEDEALHRAGMVE